MPNVPHKIIVHHSGDSSPKDQLPKINADHKQRGFPQSRQGYFVGYHFLINEWGRVTRTRDDDEVGAHDAGENQNSIGVCLEGNFDEELPTAVQKDALGALLAELCKTHKLSALDIEPHRIRDDTSCYGRRLSDHFASLCYIEHEVGFIKKPLSWVLLVLQNYLAR